MRIETFHLKFLPVKQLSILTVALFLLLPGCSSNLGPGGGATKVSFNTEDGIQLSGHLFGSGEVGVVLSHMRPADQESWWPFARVLKDKGYQVIAYDFRGYRDSLGEVDLDNIDKDVQAAVDFLRSKGVSKVFLIGASMGGTASLKVASLEDVDGVVTLSAPSMSEGLDAREDVTVISAPKLFMAAGMMCSTLGVSTCSTRRHPIPRNGRLWMVMPTARTCSPATPAPVCRGLLWTS